MSVRNPSSELIGKERNLELDALRGIAALMIVFFHLTMGAPESQLGFKYGVTGVNLFFIISGFVIYKSIESTRTSIDFLINRFSRLFPTYWTIVTFTFILIILHPYFWPDQSIAPNYVHYLGNLTMFQYYFKMPNLDDPYWSMIVEMNFYIFAFVFLFFRRIRYFSAIGVVIACISSASYFFMNDAPIVQHLFYYCPLLFYFPLFLSGISFFNLYGAQEKKIRIYFVLLALYVSQLALFHVQYADGSSFLTFNEHLIMLTVFYFVFLLFILNQLKFIVNRVTLFFGKISFALYLLHQFISLNYILPYAKETLKIDHWIAAFLIAFPIVVLIAFVITFYIEIPLNKKLRRKHVEAPATATL